jgi:hypothetical protein
LKVPVLHSSPYQKVKNVSYSRRCRVNIRRVSTDLTKILLKPDVVVHAFNPSTQKEEAGGWQIPGQPGLYREIPISKNQGMGI